MIQSLHERLLVWATSDPRKEEVLVARRSYFERYGEPNEEDKTFEVRMNGFLDWYMYDYKPGGGTETTVEVFIRSEAPSLTAEELGLYRGLANNVHSLFEIRRLRSEEIRVRDVFTSADHDVTERRHVAGLNKGDLIEARLLPFESCVYFSGSFLFHPALSRKAILAQVKRMKKAAAGAPTDIDLFLGQLSKMALKLERYRNVKVESIYSFQ